MSAASSLTARIMETWAHGQDVADTVGIQCASPPTGCVTSPTSGSARRPTATSVQRAGRCRPLPIRVELDAPERRALGVGARRCADDRVIGPALDFCLAVTQRRHRDDTALTITGPVATEWMAIAQAYAGVAGTGRERTLVTRPVIIGNCSGFYGDRHSRPRARWSTAPGRMGEASTSCAATTSPS